MPRLLVDLTPFRTSAQFRRLWFGYAVNQVGSQLTIVAVAYQVFQLTGSSFYVGLVSLVQLGPAIVGPIIGGSIADAVDRRTLLLFTNAGGAMCSVGLAVCASAHVSAIWPVFLFAAISAAFAGADNPTRTAMMISFVDRETFPAANALRTLMQQVAFVVGPAIAGLLLSFGIEVAYWADAATFAIALVAVATLDRRVPADTGSRFGLHSIAEGFQFLRGRQAVQGCFAADLNATILGMPNSLFPAVALHQLHGGPQTLGLLYAAPGAGAITMVLVSGWMARVQRPGRAVLAAVAVWGVAIAGFGFSTGLVIALAWLAVAGGANVVSAVFRSTIIQAEAPDRLRGRLTSLQTSVVQAGPMLGNAESGVVGSLIGVQLAVVTGGLGAVAGICGIAYLMPKFRTYERRRTEILESA